MMSERDTDIKADRIERSIHIAGSRQRVWQALSDAASFGAWFGADLAGQTFVPGGRVRGPITSPGYEHLFFDAVVERIDAQQHFSFYWHPYAGGAPDDPSEPQTLVSFTLAEAPGGILLTVVESGFDKLPAHRRRQAFGPHTQGWEAQLRSIAGYAVR